MFCILHLVVVLPTRNDVCGDCGVELSTFTKDLDAPEGILP
jgi:hypothetical protein